MNDGDDGHHNPIHSNIHTMLWHLTNQTIIYIFIITNMTLFFYINGLSCWNYLLHKKITYPISRTGVLPGQNGSINHK